jgi:hypothetical protein
MLDIDTAIKHCLEVAEQNETQAEKIGRQFIGSAMDKRATDCRECAADRRQLAEWLKELSQRRERCAQYEVEQISNLEQYDMLSREYEMLNERYKEAIRLLKLAVGDLNNIGSCKTCVKFGDICRGCRTDYKWVHADEALALIGEDGDTNG